MKDLYNDPMFPNLARDFDPDTVIAALLTPDCSPSYPDYKERIFGANMVKNWTQMILKFGFLQGAKAVFIARDKDDPCGLFLGVLLLEVGSEAYYNFKNRIEMFKDPNKQIIPDPDGEFVKTSDFLKLLNSKNKR
jgi:hypothetical protein